MTSLLLFSNVWLFIVSVAPHIGHLFTSVLADVVSRWYAMRGTTVRFSTGSDEHGLKVLCIKVSIVS